MAHVAAVVDVADLYVDERTPGQAIFGTHREQVGLIGGNIAILQIVEARSNREERRELVTQPCGNQLEVVAPAIRRILADAV